MGGGLQPELPGLLQSEPLPLRKGPLQPGEEDRSALQRWGGGARVTVLDDERSRLDFSLAVLAERTVERDSKGADDELLARWTGRFRLRRSFSDARVVLNAEAEYNPVFDEFANFTVKSETSLSFALSRVVSLKLSLVDNYDRRAESRGALSNSDGRLLFSVLGSF